jgi:hypothetical protein
MFFEKYEQCPNGCTELEWAYDAQMCRACGYNALKPHSCEEVTQESRLENDRDWRAKLDQAKAELAFWKHQAIVHRALYFCLTTGRTRYTAEDEARAENELEAARAAENAERYAHAEPPRDIGA